MRYIGRAIGGVGGGGWLSEEANTGAHAAGKEDDGVKVIMAILHGRQRLKDISLSVWNLGHTRAVARVA
jgi:hypothetical protein